jgi:hypothetical protein
MRRALLTCLVTFAALLLVLARAWSGDTVPLAVEFKLTDDQYQPLSGVPVRLVFGGKDWQGPNAGVRIVTGEDGTAHFTAQAVIDRRWHFTNVGFTPLSVPSRVDHLALAIELAFATPRRDGDDLVHHWLYTADIDRLSDGDCSTYDLDKVYAAGPDGAFTQLVGENAAGPNFDALVDGMRLSGAGYKLWEFMLAPSEGAGADKTGADKSWHLKLGLMRKPKPVLVQ